MKKRRITNRIKSSSRIKKSKSVPVKKKINKRKVSVKKNIPRAFKKTPALKAPSIPKEISSENIIFNDSYDLPSEYNNTYVTLMSRDPHWIHAYWEIGRDSYAYFKKTLGDEFNSSVRVLRIYDVSLKDFDGTNANSWFDLDVGDFAKSWYINLWNDCVSYCAEIGMRTPRGKFVSVARSNFITTPRENPSTRSDVIWMEEKDEEHLPFVSMPSVKRQGEMQQKGTFPKRKIFLTDDDIRAYYAKLFPLLRIVISAGQQMGYRDIDSELWQNYLSSNKYLDAYLSSGLSKEESLKRTKLGSSAETVLSKGASEQLVKPGASERDQREKKFFFEIGTELIVYGRTEPDADVWLGDKKVQLRSDGTFSFRYSLKDGSIPLDFKAFSKNGIDKKEIRTAVVRKKTQYYD